MDEWLTFRLKLEALSKNSNPANYTMSQSRFKMRDALSGFYVWKTKQIPGYSLRMFIDERTSTVPILGRQK